MSKRQLWKSTGEVCTELTCPKENTQWLQPLSGGRGSVIMAAGMKQLSTHTHTQSVLQLLCKTHPEWLFTSQVTGPQSPSPSLWFWSCDVSPIICISNKFQVVLICWFKVHTLRLLVVEKEKRKKPFPSPGDLPDPGIKPQSPALQVDFLPSELQRLQGRCYLIFQSLIF